MSLTSKPSITRKLSGVLSRKNSCTIVTSQEMPPTSHMNPHSPTNTLSLRCKCGYVKTDVMCLGDIVDREARLFHFCGGLFIVKKNGVECTKFRKTAKSITFSCAFCGRMEDVSVSDRLRVPDRPLSTPYSTCRTLTKTEDDIQEELSDCLSVDQ